MTPKREQTPTLRRHLKILHGKATASLQDKLTNAEVSSPCSSEEEESSGSSTYLPTDEEMVCLYIIVLLICNA